MNEHEDDSQGKPTISHITSGHDMTMGLSVEQRLIG